MSTTLDGITLADPLWGEDGYTKESVDVGARHETADGRIHQDYIRSRSLFGLKWKGRTETEKDTAHTAYLNALADVVVFSPPDSTATFNVLGVLGSWKESYVTDSGGTRYYTFEMKVEDTAQGRIIAVAETLSMSDTATVSIP